MPGQLKVLKSCRHPKTFEPIPKPVTLKQWEAMKLQPPIPIQPRPPRRRFTGIDDGTSLTQAFIRTNDNRAQKGVAPDPVARIRARLARAKAAARHQRIETRRIS